MELIYLTLPMTPGLEETAPEGVPLRCCTDLSVFPPETDRSAVFLLGHLPQDEVMQVVLALRRDPRTGLQPIFTLASLGETGDRICDGCVQTVREAVEQARPLVDRLQQLDCSLFNPEAGDFFRILGFMYSRTGMLEPVKVWSQEALYTFPVLEIMLGSVGLVASRLAGMHDRKLIQRTHLVDRLRHCPACNGVLLNFIDCCPNCVSIDILQKPFLHCFTCGTVLPEDRFVDKGVLQCPNCRTRLRHIGADYDRPLENYECQHCRHVFIEPVVQAHCMRCATRSQPDQLVPEQVFGYELTDLGIQAAKSGTMEDLFALLDTINSVTPSYFMKLVGWLLDLVSRYPDEQFSIIGIKLNNLLELDARFGKQVVAELLDALALRLRELIRATDLTTRTGQEMFWLLMPKTGRPNHQVVLDRILELRNMAYRVEGVGLDFDTVVFNAPEEVTPGETGKLLLARLEGGIE